MVRARSDWTFNKPLGIASGTSEEEGQTDKMGRRSERAEKADDQGLLPPHINTWDFTYSARCYNVFVSRCLLSLSCSENWAWEPCMYSIYKPLWYIPVYTYVFWISQCWECVQQDAGRSHEGGGLRLLDVIPRQHPDLQWRTLGPFRTFDTGCLGTQRGDKIFVENSS